MTNGISILMVYRFPVFLLLPLVLCSINATTAQPVFADECPGVKKARLPQQKIELYTQCITSGKSANGPLAVLFNRRGAVFAATGSYREAVEDYNRALELAPGSAQAYHDRGVAYQRMGEIKQALKDHARAIEIKPGWDAPYLFTGLACKKLGRFKEAVEAFNKALAINPGFVRGYVDRGLAYQGLGDYSAAIRDCNRALALDPKTVPAFAGLGRIYWALGAHQSAIDNYTRALKLDPRFVPVLINRGRAFQALGQFDRAAADFDRAVALAPENEQAVFSRAGAGLMSGRQKLVNVQKQAIADYQKIIKKNPLSAQTFDALARLLAEGALPELRKPEKAVALALKAVDLTKGDNPVFLATLALAHAENRQFGKAAAAQAKAVRIVESAGGAQQAKYYQQALARYRTLAGHADNPNEGQ